MGWSSDSRCEAAGALPLAPLIKRTSEILEHRNCPCAERRATMGALEAGLVEGRWSVGH